MRSYEFMDPARVLEIKGEDCMNCCHLGKWRIGGEMVTACDNNDAPVKKRAHAPDSRCIYWKHFKQDSGI